MIVLALFLSTFLLVMALGAQSLLVNNGRYLGAFLNSFVIGSGWEIAAFLCGGPFGICTAMFLLRKYHRRNP